MCILFFIDGCAEHTHTTPRADCECCRCVKEFFTYFSSNQMDTHCAYNLVLDTHYTNTDNFEKAHESFVSINSPKNSIC